MLSFFSEMSPARVAEYQKHLCFASVLLLTVGAWTKSSDEFVWGELHLLEFVGLAYILGFANSRWSKPAAKGAKLAEQQEDERQPPDAGRLAGWPWLPKGCTDAAGKGEAEGEAVARSRPMPKAPRVAPDWTGRLEPHMHVITKAQQEGIGPGNAALVKVMEACGACGHKEMGLEVFRKMLARDIASNPDESMGTISVDIAIQFFRLVAESLDEQTMRQHGLELLRTIQAFGLEPTRLVQNLVLVAWKSKPPEHVLEYFVKMKDQGVKLSPTAYRCIMAACERTDPARTLQLYEEMQDRGVKIDVVAFNAAMCALCQLGTPVKALQVAAHMSEHLHFHGAMPNSKSYGILINACTSAMMSTEALQLFERMKAEGFKPSRFAYHDAILCCVREEDIQRALALHADMEREQIIPCRHTRHLLSKVCQKHGMDDVAWTTSVW